MNNRIIKFRVWNKSSKSYLKQYQGTEATGLYIITPFNNLYANSIYDKIDLIFQQFTGLLDKNGTEIYEGDILMFFQSQPKYNLIGEYTHREEVKVYTNIEWWTSESRFTGRDILGKHLGYDFHSGFTDRCEVVGNIFENPEMVKNLA